MNDIILIGNLTDKGTHTERIYISTLDSFLPRYFNLEICRRGNLTFKYWCYEFEVVETIPEMEPEELLKIWRLIYE